MKRRHPNEREEIDNLKKLNHRHIVKIVSSFTHRQYLGVLLWPAVECNLATFFNDLDVFETNKILRDFKKSNLGPLHRFGALGIDVSSCKNAATHAREWMYRNFACLVEAICYAHGNKIRHKDLKPSSILLTPVGLRVAGFDSSADFSDLPSSETSYGKRGTSMYFAPEFGDRKGSGRPADIFSLGCIFLEMVWSSCMLDQTMEDLNEARSF